MFFGRSKAEIAVVIVREIFYPAAGFRSSDNAICVVPFGVAFGWQRVDLMIYRR
jgi:hypothetical protein